MLRSPYRARGGRPKGGAAGLEPARGLSAQPESNLFVDDFELPQIAQLAIWGIETRRQGISGVPKGARANANQHRESE